ncbi:hypothetical protein ANN_02754 [Periplaneta americana]|uniref:Uncharacterized protein n=1 Tax=Periplaneta americana TaxID=6978 RepID=A0ABQ8TZM6_PERAM|nr:hypothetical protein ANN_02754 [Periplaneta americana]
MAGLCEGSNEPPDSLKAMKRDVITSMPVLVRLDLWVKQCGYLTTKLESFRGWQSRIPRDVKEMVMVVAIKNKEKLQHPRVSGGDLEISSHGVKSGDRGGHFINAQSSRPVRPIHLSQILVKILSYVVVIVTARSIFLRDVIIAVFIQLRHQPVL